MKEAPIGERFSFTYIEKGPPKTDSKTMRYRISQLFNKEAYLPKYMGKSYSGRNQLKATAKPIIQALQEELGVPFQTNVVSSPNQNWYLYFSNLTEVKFLDSFTVVYRVLEENRTTEDFIHQVNRIFREENISYKLDAAGGVHPIIDIAFNSSKESVIRGMSNSKYDLSKRRIEEIDGYITGPEPDYVQAIRSVFGSAENIFKVMFNVPRLDKKSAVDKIGKRLQVMYDGHPTMQRSSAQVLQSFGAWVDAAHHYRHETGSSEPTQPDEALSIVLISEGMTFVRWLISIDQVTGK